MSVPRHKSLHKDCHPCGSSPRRSPLGEAEGSLGRNPILSAVLDSRFHGNDIFTQESNTFIQGDEELLVIESSSLNAVSSSSSTPSPVWPEIK